MSDETAFAISILAMVVGILGAPFAKNEYTTWVDPDKINRNFNHIWVADDPP
jgi:hypothetical protein